MSVKIEKLIHGGQGLGKHENGKVALVWNALPGEEVGYFMTSKRRDYFEGIADRIIITSPHRITEKEPHFLSCSPWQILSYEEELKWKVSIAKETYMQLGGFENDVEIVTDSKEYGYRNKMEYSFAEDEKGELSLAFFKRGQKRKIPIDSCQLAHDIINYSAKHVLNWLQENKIHSNQLKTLILRSNQKGEIIMGLFVKEKIFLDTYIKQLHEKGFHIYYSNPQSPASIITEVIYSDGESTILERVGDSVLEYGLLSFFQVNIPVFMQTLKDITSFIKSSDMVLDYYSGVGSIGLSVTNNQQNLTLIENNKEAYEMSLKNMMHNARSKVESVYASSEKATQYMQKDQIVILDPPRAGLHKDMVKVLQEIRPKTMVYLSCNVATQARDVGMLLGHYSIDFLKLYNYFPRTPHIESLIVLQRR